MKSTIQEIFNKNIQSDSATGITFIDGRDSMTHLSYKKLYLEACYKLHALQEKGLKPGDELIFQFESNRNFVITFWACVFGKIIPVPVAFVAAANTVKKICGVWKKLKNPYIITDNFSLKDNFENFKKDDAIFNEMLEKFIHYDELPLSKKAVPLSVDESDIVFIQFSSGSTGSPKGVINIQEGILYNYKDYLKQLNVNEKDRFLGWVPLTHDMGLIFFHILPLLSNNHQFLMPPTLFLTYPELWMKSMSDHEITISGSPNFGYKVVLDNLDRIEKETLSLDKLRLMINSAEPVSIDDCKKFNEEFASQGLSKDCIKPAYGLAEAVLGVSICHNKKEERVEYLLDRGRLNVGDEIKIVNKKSDMVASFANLGTFEATEITIVNESDQILPDKKLGYIKLKSKAVTKGYYNDSVTTKKYISNDGWLNTGDIGFIDDKQLVITGRAKEMIIVNGQNYFPNDLDYLLAELPGVNFQQAVSCNIFNENTYSDEIFVFVLYKDDVESFSVLTTQIKQHISLKLGIEVSKVVAVNQIPKTTSGKIQRYILRERYLNGSYDAFLKELNNIDDSINMDSYVAPSTDLEIKLVKIWEDALGIECVGIEDNFFYLGGNSIGIGLLASRIQEVFETNIDIHKLFTRIDFKDQLKLIKDSLGKTTVKIKSTLAKSHYPLFGTQKRLFSLHQMNPETIAYNTPILLKVQGSLNTQLCEDVFKKIIDRHEILRTSFEVVGDQPVQRVHPDVDFSVQYVNNETENVQELLRKHTKPFDLSKPPLLRVLIVKEDNVVDKIILDIHHIVIDASSFEILIQEFQVLYRKGTLENLKFQYKDFIEYEEEKKIEKSLDTQKEFWLKSYENLPETLNMPFDFVKSDVKNSKGDTVTFNFDVETREKLRTICQQQEVTMSTLTLSVFYILLAKLTNQEDIIIGTSTLGRWQGEFKDLIGLFINTLPLRSFPKGNIQFLKFLNTVKEHVLDCLSNEEYSFDQLLNDLELKNRPNQNPLFDVTFEYHNFNWSDMELPDVNLSRINQPNLFSRFDLVLRVVEKGDDYEFNLDYPTSLFNRETIERFASYYVRIMDEILKDTNTSLKDIQVLSKSDTVQLLNEFNDTTAPYAQDKTVLDTFSDQVLLKPQALALVFNQEQLTYKELDSRSTIWAEYYLVEYNVQAGDVVALMMTRSIDVVTAMFSIMKAGATYLPIDADLPTNRIAHMLAECNVKTVITNIEDRPVELESYSWVSVLELHNLKKEVSKIILPNITTESLMYIIYTSGSTGKPKGVMMGQRSIVNLVKGLKERVYFTYGHRSLKVALLASHSFDASVQQIFGALLLGHSLYITNNETRKDGDKLLSFYNDNKIDLTDGTPTHLRFFIEALDGGAVLNTLSSWILAGELLPKELVKLFYSKLGHGTQLYNFYGPTEACVDSIGYKIDFDQLDKYNHIPIGKPLPNERIYITDQYGQLVPIGIIGELCIAGDGLAKGYVGDSLLTSKKFDSEWVSGKERVYRTGDMAKWLPDGNLEYHGRNDDHVKIRGFRIHLGEIEGALNRLPKIQQAIVLVNETNLEDKQLVGYIVSEEEIDNKKIQEVLSTELPEYMIPRVYVQLPFFPVTSSNKIDKRLLKIPNANDNYVAPISELETQLAILWQEVLGVEKVGVYDNFYELGGDSIKAIQLASRGKASGIHFQVKDIFNHQTVSEIVMHLKAVDTVIQELGFLEGEVPMHPIQKHFFGREYEAIDHYNQVIMIKISKSITKEVLDFALSELTKQHDALRMRYQKDESKKYPSQWYDSTTPELLVEEIASLSDMSDVCSTYQADLDIFKGDISRFVFFKTASEENENRLFIAIHHLVVDGVSLRILTEDLMNLIENHLLGNKTTLPIKGTSYRQWNEKLNSYAATHSLKKEHLYWKKVLSNYTPLPIDIAFDKTTTYQETKSIRVSLSSTLTHTLVHDINNIYRTEINDVLISALTMALSKWVNKSKVVIGLEGHGREELFKGIDINRTVGWFTSVYPVCLNVEDVEDIDILIADTKDMLRDVPNKGIGYGVLRFESDSENIKSDLSMFYEDLIFNYLGSFDNSFSTEQKRIGNISSEASGFTVGRQNVNLHKVSIDCIIVDGCLYIDLNYDTNRYKDTTIQKLANAYISALENILTHSHEFIDNEENLSKNKDFEILSL